MQIGLKGPGEIAIRLINRRGQTLVQQQIFASGPSTIELTTTVDLVVNTTDGEVLVAPVLVRQNVETQNVTFDGQPPSVFTKKRCQEIGCSPTITDEAERGCAPQLEVDVIHFPNLAGRPVAEGI
jgi:hypothetical protein